MPQSVPPFALLVIDICGLNTAVLKLFLLPLCFGCVDSFDSSPAFAVFLSAVLLQVLVVVGFNRLTVSPSLFGWRFPLPSDFLRSFLLFFFASLMLVATYATLGFPAMDFVSSAALNPRSQRVLFFIVDLGVSFAEESFSVGIFGHSSCFVLAPFLVSVLVPFCFLSTIWMLQQRHWWVSWLWA